MGEATAGGNGKILVRTQSEVEVDLGYFRIFKFVSPGLTAVDSGGGMVTITASGGGGGGGTVTSVVSTDASVSIANPTTVPDLSVRAYWQTVPGAPARVGNYSFTITDTANAGLYDQLLSRTTVLKWTDSGSTKMAMVASAVYAANTVTITTLGDILSATATMNTLKYSIQKADIQIIQQAGNVIVANDISYRLFAPCGTKPFGSFATHGTAGVTNPTTYNISKNSIVGGGAILSSDLSIASAATLSSDQTIINGTSLIFGDYLTVNCISTSTTNPIDTYIHICTFPSANQYL